MVYGHQQTNIVYEPQLQEKYQKTDCADYFNHNQNFNCISGFL